MIPSSASSSQAESAPSAPRAVDIVARVPRALRKEADAMSFDRFLAEYSPHTGPLRLGHWACTDAERPARRLGPQPRHYQATLAFGDRIGTATAAAFGPVAALTEMLYDQGVAVEMMAFHQMPAGAQIATFIHGSDGARTEWAMGVAGDPTQSALRAVIACANRLLAAV
ncbi:homocitrate synthase [Mycobacterium sp. WMMD1722]|uniref:homocitrate synthase n=1 Tax=Mycobacterium sp. WMMD1722 TaxID=3404117 RepID=UPI003BF575E7